MVFRIPVILTKGLLAHAPAKFHAIRHVTAWPPLGIVIVSSIILLLTLIAIKGFKTKPKTMSQIYGIMFHSEIKC